MSTPGKLHAYDLLQRHRALQGAQEAGRLRNQGLTLAKIGERLGVSPERVRQKLVYLKRYGAKEA